MSRKTNTLIWAALSVLAVLLVYSSVLVELGRDWLRDSNYSHGLLIPFISGFLIWSKRKELAGLPTAPSNWGIPGLVVAALLLVLGSAAAEVFTQRISFLLMVGSAVIFLAGWKWARVLAFPVALMLLAIPLPYVIYYSLTGPMQALAAKMAIVGLKGVGLPAVAEGNIIHLPQATLEVAEACSGIRSLYAFLAVGAIMAYSLPMPLPGKVALFLSTIPLSVLGNAVRVWGSGMAAHLAGIEATTGTAHEMFGLFVFAISLIVLVLIRKGVGLIWRSDPSSSS